MSAFLSQTLRLSGNTFQRNRVGFLKVRDIIIINNNNNFKSVLQSQPVSKPAT